MNKEYLELFERLVLKKKRNQKISKPLEKPYIYLGLKFEN